ncbi:hypothetical protein LUZ60_009873 [Juncus effusus]|nr:hypothetical protein LUZ60_009873 [Juncus effusus]
MDMLTAMTMPYHYGKSNSPLSNFQHSTLLCNLSISVSMKGSELQYSTLLVLVTSIDLSRNQLTGEIPQSITSLLGLRNLNLSYNQLDGTIPKEIGKMQSLESLDFCMNEISGIIPYNLANLNFLTTLNLSYNNFSGKIPTGDQLQTLLDPSIYMDNPYLCGSPLYKSCSTSENSHDFNVQGNDNNLDEILLVLFTVLGFGFGFWMFFGVLIFKRNWRYQLFQMVDDILDRIYVPVMVFIARSCNDTTE